MLDTNNGAFTVQNMLAKARTAIPVCDTVLDALPASAHELGPKWEATQLLSYRDGERPQAALFQDDEENAVVVIAGLGSPRDFALAATGSLSPGQHAKIPGRFNGYGLLWFASVEYWWRNFFPSSFRSIHVVGHSMGGVVASLLAYLMNAERKSQNVTVFTCGSPRFADRVGARALSTLPILRLMNYTDIVPAVPPRPADAPTIYPLLQPDQILSWLQLVHTSGGLSINSTGHLVQSDLPLGYATPLQYDLRTLHTLFSNANLPAHMMQQYADKLEVLVPVSPGLRLHNAVPEPIPEEPVTAAVIKQVQANSRQYIAAVGAQQTKVPASAARVLVKIKRRSRRYFVEVNGKPFYTATSRRDAIGVARATRDFARQYLQNPTLFSDPAALIQELDAS